jgi:hypothetical protein
MLWFGLALIALTATQVPRPAARADSIRLRLTLPATYRNDSVQARRLVTLARLLPARMVEMEARQSIAHVIVREYGFGVSDLPQFYRVLRDEILRINNLASEREASAGLVAIPRLPRWATVGSQVRDTVPDYRVLGPIKVMTAIQGAAAIIVAPTNKSVETPQWKREAPSAEYVTARPTSDDVDYDALMALADSVGATIGAEGPFFFELDDTGATPTPYQGIPTAERNAIQTALRHPSGKRSSLYILDTGWPSREARDTSVAALVRLINSVRTKRKLTAVAPLISYTHRSTFDRPGNTHADLVAAALSDFVALDEAARVKVVYVPLSREQDSADILEPLIETYLLLKEARWAGTVRLTAADAAAIKRSAAAIVAKLTNVARDENRLYRSAHEILNAVWNLAEYAASNDGDYYVLSTSWIVRGKGTVLPVIPPTPTGVLLAGAGNLKEKVVDESIDLAMRGSDQRNILAVMNVPSDRLDCDSGTMETVSNLSRASVLAYDGTLRDGKCGTSMATPRAAWILALDQTQETTSPTASRWAEKLQDRLLTLRSANGGLAGTRLDVVRLLQRRP